jgi:hypothetical protein
MPITRILRKCPLEYLGFFQLVTSLVDLEYAKLQEARRITASSIALRHFISANIAFVAFLSIVTAHRITTYERLTIFCARN